MNRRAFLAAFGASFVVGCGGGEGNQTVLTTQLNWLHDPTFVAHYRMGSSGSSYRVREGGPNVFPIQAVGSGIVDAAVCGFDVFVRYALERDAGAAALRAVFCDFQRNPVGWVLHPSAASQVGIDVAAYNSGDSGARAALLESIRSRSLRVGDKVGTETTSIMRTWLATVGVEESALITPVGFDSAVVLSAPRLLFPVYLNEEPFRIREALGGRDLLIVDPVVDGVALYGNVVVMRAGDARVAALQGALADAWTWARDNTQEAVELVGRHYRSVQPSTLRRQIEKTTEFAFYGGGPIGSFEINEGGRVDRSLGMLQRGGTVPPGADFSALKQNFQGPGR